jgi:hypothetical protein
MSQENKTEGELTRAFEDKILESRDSTLPFPASKSEDKILESRACTLPFPTSKSLHFTVAIEPCLAIKTLKPSELMILHNGGSIIN